MPAPATPIIGVVAEQRPVQVSAQRALPFTGTYAHIVRYVAAAGGSPVLIPPGLHETAMQTIYAHLNGVLLAGGGDIAPSSYGETESHPSVHGVDPVRDRSEIQLTRWAVADGLPLLGICRGHQLLNVALGGQLIQDIPSHSDTSINHNTLDTHPVNYRAHTVRVEADSRLAALTGTGPIPVNSLHHQALKSPGKNLVVSAYAPDGIIEATENPQARFLLSVQWHPEMIFEEDQAALALCQALIHAARQPITT